MNSKGLERQEFKEMAKIFQIILNFFYLRFKKNLVSDLYASLFNIEGSKVRVQPLKPGRLGLELGSAT